MPENSDEKVTEKISINSEAANKIAEICTEFYSNQLATIATGVVAQPFISFVLKMSLEKRIRSQSYQDKLKILHAVSAGKILNSLQIGYHRRIVSAIPLVVI